MFPLIALALTVLVLSRRKAAPTSGQGMTPILNGGPRQPVVVPDWTFSFQYADANKVLWNIEEKSKASAYRGTASSGKYAGRQFTLPTWPILKTTIDAFATTQAAATATGLPGGFPGLPVGTIPGMGETFGLGPSGVPAGTIIGNVTFGADAPMQPTDRVTFDVIIPAGDVYGAPTTFLGRLEGRYEGSSDPSAGPARVVADRIALQGSESPLPLGAYAIPASASASFHDKLQRVEWAVIDPAAAGLRGFSPAPYTPPGTPLTVVVADRQLTKVAAIAQVVSADADGNLVLRLLRPYLTIDDSGRGPITFPFQTTLVAKSSQLVDPTSLPTV